MPHGLYADGREGFLAGDIDWDANVIKAVLVDGTLHTPDLATHTYLSDIPVGARVATSLAFFSKTVTDGVADAANAYFAAVSGNPARWVVIYKDTGVASTSRLIACIDPQNTITFNGNDVTVAWSDLADRIFKL